MSADGGDASAPGSAGARRRRALLWVLPIVLVATALLASYRVAWRAQRDPAFCAGSCHAPKEATGTLAAGAHRKDHPGGAACQACHAVSIVTGLKLWYASDKAEKVVAHGKVEPASCVSCHEKDQAKWAAVTTTQGHREHKSAKKVDCLSCHAKTTHGDEPPEKACVTCHKDERLHKDTTAKDAETCLSCHGYSATAKNAPPPTTQACARCHGDAALVAAPGAGAVSSPLRAVNEHVLHGGVACQLCHNAHGKKIKAPEGQPLCVKCHQIEQFQAGAVQKVGPEGHRNCEGCHQPHAPLKSATQSCIKCHEKNARGIPLPPVTAGAAGAKARATPVLATVAGHAADGKTSALKHDGCASCHLPHSWRAERSGCMQCHEDKAKLILTRSPAAHSACTNCHQVHGPPPSGAVCVSCHAKTKGSHVALAPERHKDCTSCHNPHAPMPQDTRNACIKCHDKQVTQMTRDGPEGHKACLDCHKPHDNPLPSKDICAKCHAEKAKLVATASPPKHRTCTSCHEKHKFRISEPSTACSKCHGPTFQASAMAAAKVPHQGDCKKCHTLHGSPGIPKASCLKCHEKVAAEFNPPNEKHANCRSCHQPHQPVATASAACATCHDAKATTATKWPPSSAHAKACNGCHQQHDVRNKKTCDTCHAQETASAMGSKHKCTQCHAPHQPPPGTGAAWWSRCATCHAAKVESVKQRGPIHSECKNCHQTHRFAKPTCTSCHTDIASKGLHSVAKHAANCSACHDPHVKSVPTPPQCLSCHTDRRAHEPNAQACQACHTFK
jgi:Cytochrome c3